MSETITELVLPGTYIEVRAEGLISVSGIATGNVGVVGTASKGPLDEVVLLGSYADAVDVFGPYDAWSTGDNAHPLTLTRTIEQLFRGGASTVYAVRITATPTSARWDLPEKGKPESTVFSLVAKKPGTEANALAIDVSFDDQTELHTLSLKLDSQEESFSGEHAKDLFDAINATNAGSKLVTAGKAPTTSNGPVSPVLPAGDEAKDLETGDVNVTAAGADGTTVGSAQLAPALLLLEKSPVHILVLGGFDVSDGGGDVKSHLDRTENDGRERIAVLGTRSVIPSEIATEAGTVGSPRLVLVAPGIVAADAASPDGGNVDLPPSYAAALVAGRLATLAAHVSPTNKDVAAAGLTRIYNRTEQKALLGNRVLVLQQNLGFRILKGITTDQQGAAFQQITTRRIVDYAKAGVRIGANPYIGKLNNARVRGALEATLNGFLSGMVLDEMLIGYDLTVTANRNQEVAGIAVVTMTLQPTFSIDFVKVIMNLG